jgi:hypothetical protein
MDSEITSPVEPQTSIMKQKLGVSDKIDTKRKWKNTEYTNRTIQQKKGGALRSLNQTNISSKSPTKDS